MWQFIIIVSKLCPWLHSRWTLHEITNVHKASHTVSFVGLFKRMCRASAKHQTLGKQICALKIRPVERVRGIYKQRGLTVWWACSRYERGATGTLERGFPTWESWGRLYKACEAAFQSLRWLVLIKKKKSRKDILVSSVCTVRIVEEAQCVGAMEWLSIWLEHIWIRTGENWNQRTNPGRNGLAFCADGFYEVELAWIFSRGMARSGLCIHLNRRLEAGLK